MATQPEKAFSLLKFLSTKSVINLQREFRRNFEKDISTANSIRKWYKDIWTQVAPIRGRLQTDPV
jgi:hypothetical protein